MSEGSDGAQGVDATHDVASATQQALARRAGLGDRAAYEELFRRLFPATYRFALRMLDLVRIPLDFSKVSAQYDGICW